jgi:benzoyl-CoA reductase subunit C
MTEAKGLAKAAYIYENRSQWAKDLKAGGKEIAGYLCCYPPLELISAAGYVPFRVLGDMSEPITAADTYLPTVMCSFYRSCMDLAMKGKFDFFDAFIGCHACDGAERVTYVWRSYLKYKCSFYLDVPHTAHAPAIEFFKGQLNYFKQVLEETGGKKIEDAKIKEMITLYNKQRRLVHELYGLRKADPSPISGTEVLQVIVALMSMPVDEGNAMLEEVLAEVRQRPAPKEKKKRVVVWGSLMDNISLTKLIEECGLEIVTDDTAIGTRSYGHLVEMTEDPLEGLADVYLNKLVCPRTFRETGASRDEDLENRFGYVKKFAQDWNAKGVIANIVRNCDIHGYELPEFKYYIEKMDIPVLVIEQDYSTAALAPLRTRFQAFAESLD